MQAFLLSAEWKNLSTSNPLQLQPATPSERVTHHQALWPPTTVTLQELACESLITLLCHLNCCICSF